MPDRRSLALQMRIGAFVVLSLLIFLAVIYLLGAQSRIFERKYELYADFTEVGGLIEGATVRLAGVQIGRVTKVVLSPEVGGKVRVTLTVARRFAERIRRDSEAQIVTQGLLGDKLVEITQGKPEAPALKPGEVIATKEFFEMGRLFASGGGTLAAINKLADTLQRTLEKVDATGAVEDLQATVKSARRVVEQVETGKGWLHVLLYEEPEALRQLNGLLADARETLARTRSGDNAVSVLLSPESGRSARALLESVDSLTRAVAKAKGPGGADEPGLLPTLLFDPQYKPVAEDVRAVARNFREVSDRLVQGQGFIGGLLSEKGDGPMGEAAADFRVAMSNLRVITDRLKAGEGTVGGLLEDPTVYENLAAFLEGAQRSFLLRSLIRSSIGNTTGGNKASGNKPMAGEKK
jgi:phospholipid/cholesterol/gamma-HCH transport system substrate-binding protein